MFPLSLTPIYVPWGHFPLLPLLPQYVEDLEINCNCVEVFAPEPFFENIKKRYYETNVVLHPFQRLFPTSAA